ncbi:MAG: DUF2973 domain-containing protein [Leptolyngbyaceae bacterium]|nr:DUF2973 domain-containing protein [Leptolyngbyaceae bacterium]
MLHLIYILVFTILAFLAIGNLIRSMLTLGLDYQRSSSRSSWLASDSDTSPRRRVRSVPHPEFLDESGNLMNEPLLVMRSMTVEDVREHLDALYNSSPSASGETPEEA